MVWPETLSRTPWRLINRLGDPHERVPEPDPEGSTPLFVAARNGHVGIIETLFKARADINLANKKQQTPAWIAARNGEHACLELIIKLHADVHRADETGTTPAMVAAQRGHDAILGLLLQENADLNAKEEDGCTAALLAAHNGHPRCLNLLSTARADLALANTKGHTPLMMAAQQGEEECLEALIFAAADAAAEASDGGAGDSRLRELLDAADEDGQTAVFAAAQGGHARCVELLHGARADVSLLDKAGDSAAAVAEAKEMPECAELLRRLMSSGPPPPRPGPAEAGRDLDGSHGGCEPAPPAKRGRWDTDPERGRDGGGPA